jgi:mono/diheme cytochrome c family protein
MRFTTGVLAAILLMSDAQAQVANVQRGLEFAQTNCARCHSINKSGNSPLSRAPPFRDLLDRYSVEGVKELLTDAFLVDHPSMPHFELNPDQIDDFIGFLATLEQ